MRQLSRGSAGADVETIQSALNYQLRSPLVPLEVDGQFGLKTDARVRKFQQLNQLRVDGIVGPKTRAKLLKRYGIKLRGRAAVAKKAPVLVAAAFNAPGMAFTLPAATVLGAGPKIAPDNFQVQAGGQKTLKNWVSPDDDPAFWSLVFAAQATYFAKSDGTHVELALGGQFAINGAPSDTKYSVQAQIQVTVVDVFDPLGPFHFASPFAQLAYQKNFSPSSTPPPPLAIGNQFSLDIVKNVLMFTVQGDLALSWNFKTGKNESKAAVTPQIFGALTVQFNL